MIIVPIVSFGQSRNWTKEQIAAADKIIVSVSNKAEDKQIAARMISAILNISEREAAKYMEDRSIEILSSIIERGIAADKIREDSRAMYEKKCLNHIEKLHNGELLTFEEMDDFTNFNMLYRYERKKLDLAFSEIPVMRNRQITYGDGSGKINVIYDRRTWSPTITLQGIVEKDKVKIHQLTATIDSKPCVIFYNDAGGPTDNNPVVIIIYQKDRSIIKDRDRILIYYLEYRTKSVSDYNSLLGFSDDGIADWRKDSVYLVDNLKRIIEDNIAEYEMWEKLYYTDIPKFDISSAMSKKAKPLPDNYKNVLKNLRYIETQGDNEIWGVSNGYDFGEVESFMNALYSEKNLENYINNTRINEYTKSIIRNLGLSGSLYRYYYYMLKDVYLKQIPQILLSNKLYVRRLYINRIHGKITYPLFIINSKSSQVFLVEWNGRPKITKIEAIGRK